MNPNNFNRGKVLEVKVVVEDGKSYQVETYDATTVGTPAESKILVTKPFYQKKIDALQAQIDKLTQFRDACAE